MPTHAGAPGSGPDRAAWLAAGALTALLLLGARAHAEATARFADAPHAAGPATPPRSRDPDRAGAPRNDSRVPRPGPSPLPGPPSGSSVLTERGRALAGSGRVLEAIRAFTEAASLDPTNGAALVALGELRERMGDLHEAEHVYARAARLAEWAGAALRRRGALRASEGRDAEAILDLAEAERLSPGDPELARSRARLEIRERAWPAALATWRRAASGARAGSDAADAALRIDGLRLLAAELDPASEDAARGRSFTRRALSLLEAAGERARAHRRPGSGEAATRRTRAGRRSGQGARNDAPASSERSTP